MVNGFVASKDSDYTTEKAVNWLLQNAETKTNDDYIELPEPKKPSDSNDTPPALNHPSGID